jgi:hypothetical protein
MTQNKIKIRYEFEYGEKSCILDTRPDSYDYPTAKELVEKYGFSEDLAFLCKQLADWYNLTINWQSPHDGLQIDNDFIYLFVEMEKATFNKLIKEVGDRYDITYNESWLKRDYGNNLPTEPVLIQH